MTLKINQPILAKNIQDGSSSDDIVPNTNVSATVESHSIKRVTFNLDGLVVNVSEADDYGGTKIGELPDRNLLILAVEIDLSVVKGETTNGIIDTTDVTLALGTAVASETPLAGGAINFSDAQSFTDTESTISYQFNNNDIADGDPGAVPAKLSDQPTRAIYLNAAASITADDTLTATGTITVLYVDCLNGIS